MRCFSPRYWLSVFILELLLPWTPPPSLANDIAITSLAGECLNSSTEQEKPGADAPFNLSPIGSATANETERSLTQAYYNCSPESTTGEVSRKESGSSLHATIRFYAVGIYVPVAIIVGICGNLATLTLLVKGVITSSSAVYLIGLAISDMMYLLVVVPNPFTTYDSVARSPSWKTVYSHYIVYIFPLVSIFYNASTWITVCFSIERYLAICHPMKAQKICTASRSRLTVVCVYFFSFLLDGSQWFSRELFPATDPSTNETFYAFKLTKLGSSKTYFLVQYWIFFISHNGMPLCLLAFLNISIATKLRSAREVRKHLTNEWEQTAKISSRDSQITRLLLGIVVAHFTCSVTAAACTLVVGFIGEAIYASLIFRTVTVFGDVLIMTNPVLDFILYANCSKAMRAAMKEMFTPRCLRSTSNVDTCSQSGTKMERAIR